MSLDEALCSCIFLLTFLSLAPLFRGANPNPETLVSRLPKGTSTTNKEARFLQCHCMVDGQDTHRRAEWAIDQETQGNNNTWIPSKNRYWKKKYTKLSSLKSKSGIINQDTHWTRPIRTR